MRRYSDGLDSRWNATCLQELTNVTGVTGQDKIGWFGHQRDMRVDHVGGTCQSQEFSDPLAIAGPEWFDADARQHPGKVGLLAPVPPNLSDHGRAGPDRGSLLLKYSQLGADRPVTSVHCHQRAGVQYSLHAASELGGMPSRDAAWSSSA
jgi:hypothetical protein